MNRNDLDKTILMPSILDEMKNLTCSHSNISFISVKIIRLVLSSTSLMPSTKIGVLVTDMEKPA